jgi:hypothetical protein
MTKNALRLRCHSAFSIRVALVLRHSFLPLLQILAKIRRNALASTAPAPRTKVSHPIGRNIRASSFLRH